jgi:hypothetical protein
LELTWPELPKGIGKLLTCFGALSMIAKFGEPETALAILNQRVNDLERKIVGREYEAKYYIYRLDWLVSAAWKFKEDEGKRGAYVEEARGLMGRAIRSVRGLQQQNYDQPVSGPTDCGWLRVC